MLRTKSGRKAHRASLKRRVFNLRHKRAVKTAVQDFQKAVGGKKASEVAASLPALFKTLDKAAKHGTIKKNKAARMKSRLSKHLASLSK